MSEQVTMKDCIICNEPIPEGHAARIHVDLGVSHITCDPDKLKQAWLKLTYPTGASCIMDPATALHVVSDDILGEATAGDGRGYEGDEWRIEVVRMTEAEVEALPEFAGP